MDRRADTAPPALGTRERILGEFVVLVAEHGYHATSISEVATAVGVSKGAILHHFGNKDGLLDAAGVLFIQRRDVEIAHAYANLERPIDQFAATVYSTILAERDDRGGARTFGREFSIFQNDPRMGRTRESRDRYVARVREMLARCMEAGVLRQDGIEIVLLQIFGMCNWTWTWYRPDGPFSAEEIAHRFTRTLLRGLAVGASAEEPDIADDRVVELVLESRTLVSPDTGAA